jgi:ectoine hydroxylase-related dioxygenase (phytanoyl-CoA dioxygenase family)
MVSHKPPEVTQSNRDTFERDGAVCLRGVYPKEAIAGLLNAWDRVEAYPTALGLQTPGEERRRVSGGDMIISNPSDHVPDFMLFILGSPVPALLGSLAGARAFGHYWDTVFTKSPHSAGPTDWHHDAGASAVRGNMLLNAWTPLTPTTPACGLECLAESHKSDVLYWPRSPNGSRLTPPPDRPHCPNFEEQRGDPSLTFLAWDMEPGDILVLHPRTTHFSRGNQTNQRRVAYATWWYGDDVVWDPRPECEIGRAEAPFAAITPGARPDPAQLPILWTSPDAK